MSQFFVAANWKLNKGPQEAQAFVETFRAKLAANEESHVVVFPPALCLTTVTGAANGSAIGVGGQNAFMEKSGAFTGENSMEVLKDCGCAWVLIGHSERRQIFMETNELLAQKVRLAIELGLRPMLCIGETLAEREAGDTKLVLKGQLDILKGLELDDQLVIAYEPVWAIGTGQVATVEQVSDTHKDVREILNDLQAGYGDSATILYGGSVKPENCAELAAIQDVNGFLVGGASLDPEKFYQLVQLSRSRMQ